MHVEMGIIEKDLRPDCTELKLSGKFNVGIFALIAQLLNCDLFFSSFSAIIAAVY